MLSVLQALVLYVYMVVIASLTCNMMRVLQVNVKQGKTVRFMQLAMGTENDMVSTLVPAGHRRHNLHITAGPTSPQPLCPHVQSRC